MDSLSPTERTQRMRLVRGRDTRPEWLTRRLAHGMGFRYRLHRRDLPGCPDLVFPSRRKVIFVHGCFWHRHDGCRLARLPKSRLAFWRPKLEGNKARDARHLLDLAQLGWRSLVIWECELSNLDQVREVMRIFLEGDE